jgi:hypothetical protein
MSSYSEYLGRLKQRIPQYVDTRPHRDAGHQTEVVKRMAAAGNLETAAAATLCQTKTNTKMSAMYHHNGGHQVQDISDVLSYNAGQALAESSMAQNAKASQIQMPCVTPQEINDKMAADPTGLGAIMIARQQNRCCTTCKKVLLAGGCACTTSNRIKHTTL